MSHAGKSCAERERERDPRKFPQHCLPSPPKSSIASDGVLVTSILAVTNDLPTRSSQPSSLSNN